MTSEYADQPLAGKKVLIVSSFFESNMPSLREHQYVRALSAAGADVTLWTTTGSNVWRFNFAKLKPTDPAARDNERIAEYRFTLKRHKARVRFSDFFWVKFDRRALVNFDIVHVIEFRQGWTAMVARAAKRLGRIVIYDHEQRADRLRTPLHRIDSALRRKFISFGSQYVDAMRHTVMANRDHFMANTRKEVDMSMWPLGADERHFWPDAELRKETRARLGCEDDDRILVFSGKITRLKRPVEVARAAAQRGWKLVVIGRIEEPVEADLKQAGVFLHIPWATPKELNEYYNAADAAIFTNFSVSYWEAALAGTTVIVPRTRFSERYVGEDQSFVLFGHKEQFVVEEELFRDDVDITASLAVALDTAGQRELAGSAAEKFSWKARGRDLVEYYRSMLGK